MAYMFFIISMIGIWIVFFKCIKVKPINIRIILIGIASIAIALTYDILLSSFWGLYYYIVPAHSIIYMVISAIFIYPPLNMIYALFLPAHKKSVYKYTSLWVFAMLVFELVSVVTKTIIFTGWKPIPWSLVTYILTYWWIYHVYRYLEETYSRKFIS